MIIVYRTNYEGQIVLKNIYSAYYMNKTKEDTKHLVMISKEGNITIRPIEDIMSLEFYEDSMINGIEYGTEDL